MGTPQQPNNRCYISEQAGVDSPSDQASDTYGRTSAEVTWEIDVNKWRDTAFVQPLGATPADLVQTSQSCEVFSPDVTLIVSEMLGRNPSMTSFTMVFQDADKEWGECASTSLFIPGSEIYDNQTQFDMVPEEEECQQVKKYRELYAFH
eukprot:13001819-Heterocapsa_arctica.AAC.1